MIDLGHGGAARLVSLLSSIGFLSGESRIPSDLKTARDFAMTNDMAKMVWNSMDLLRSNLT